MEVLLDKQALNEATLDYLGVYLRFTEPMLQYARIGKEQSDELAHPKLEHEVCGARSSRAGRTSPSFSYGWKQTVLCWLYIYVLNRNYTLGSGV